MVVSGLQLVLQMAIGNGLSFDSFSFRQDGRRVPEINVSRGEIVDTFVVAVFIVLSNKGGELGAEIAG